MILIVGALGLGCAGGKIQRPCTWGGEPAREKPAGGTKQCLQQRNKATGEWENSGQYLEWYASGRKALEGEYRRGRKHGKWSEWDESGKLISEKFFEDGVVVQSRK